MVADENDPGASPSTEGSPGKLHDKALGEAAGGFGRAIAPLGPEAGAVALQAGRLTLRTFAAVITGAEWVFDWIEGAVNDRLKDVPEDELAPPCHRQ